LLFCIKTKKKKENFQVYETLKECFIENKKLKEGTILTKNY
jgi:hypothetical protein